MSNGWNHCCNLNGSTFRTLSIHCECSCIEKKSLSVIGEFLRLFVNTFPADEKYYMLNRDNLAQPIHMQLSQKQKTFSQFSFAFLKSILNYKHFPKRLTLRAAIFPEIPSPKDMV